MDIEYNIPHEVIGMYNITTNITLNESSPDNYTGYYYNDDVTQQELIDFQYYVQGVCGNTIAILGLIGNILSIVVLSQPRMKSATSCYLIALSVYDCFVLLALMLFFALPIVYIKTGLLEWYFKLYPYLHPFAYPLALTAQTCSIYTTVGFTIERYIAVCHPLRSSRWCTISRARKALLIILFISILYNIPRMLEYKTVAYTDAKTNATVIKYATTTFGENKYFRHIYLLYLHMIIMLIIPFIILTAFNFMLILAVRKSQRAQGKVTNRQQKENSLTIMLISVIAVFLICQVPSIADNILAVVLEPETLRSPPLVKLTVISSVFVIMNSATNFYLYCLFGRKFRKVFSHMLHVWFSCCYCVDKNKQRMNDTMVLRQSKTHRFNNGNKQHYPTTASQDKKLHHTSSPRKNTNDANSKCCVPHFRRKKSHGHMSNSSSVEHSNLASDHNVHHQINPNRHDCSTSCNNALLVNNNDAALEMMNSSSLSAKTAELSNGKKGNDSMHSSQGGIAEGNNHYLQDKKAVKDCVVRTKAGNKAYYTAIKTLDSTTDTDSQAEI